MLIKRGDMFYADLSPVVGSEQGGIRPVVIIQNDVGNKHSPTVIAAAITSQTGKTKLPTHIPIGSQNSGLKSDSIVLTEQISFFSFFLNCSNLSQHVEKCNTIFIEFIKEIKYNNYVYFYISNCL